MPKEKKPAQEMPEEENVITPDEFEELEKKERKGKGKAGGLFSKKPKEKPEPQRELPRLRRRGSSNSDELIVSIEKIEAKLEAAEGLRQVQEERISRISEEIGELRSSILEKDKTFNQVESGFEKVKEIFEEMQPKKIRAELDRKEDAIEKLNAKVESYDTKMAEIRKNMVEVLAIMEKIKDLKNVVAVSETINKKMAKVEDERKETTKTAAKVESMFSELTEKMAEFHKYRDKIEFSAESMHDMMKSLDMLEVKIENALTKDDMKKIDDRLQQLETDLTDKIQVTRDIVDDLTETLKKGGVKDLLAKEGRSRIDEINKRLSEITSNEKTLKSLKEDLAGLKEDKSREIRALASEVENLKKPGGRIPTGKKAERAAPEAVPEEPSQFMQDPPGDINSMIEQCHTHIDKGNVEEARSLYNQILAAYEGSKDASFPDAEQTYGKIKRLYYRLQIYA